MATQAQIGANRANAQFSTGPRTAEGKNNSRMNALKNGLFAFSPVLPNEDPEEWNGFRNGFRNSLNPKGPSQNCVADMAAQAAWCLMVRVANIEKELVKNSGGFDSMFCESASEMTQILRYQMQQKRLMCDFLAELRRLKKEQDGPPIATNNPAHAARPAVAAPIPVAVHPDPQATETSAADAQAVEGADQAAEERVEQTRQIKLACQQYHDEVAAGVPDLEAKAKLCRRYTELGLSGFEPPIA